MVNDRFVCMARNASLVVWGTYGEYGKNLGLAKGRVALVSIAEEGQLLDRLNILISPPLNLDGPCRCSLINPRCGADGCPLFV